MTEEPKTQSKADSASLLELIRQGKMLEAILIVEAIPNPMAIVKSKTLTPQYPWTVPEQAKIDADYSP